MSDSNNTWVNEYGISLAIDAEGHAHAPKGTPEGGQFVTTTDIWGQVRSNKPPTMAKSSYGPLDKHDSISLYNAVLKTIGDRSHLSYMKKRLDEQKPSAAQKKEYAAAFKVAVSRMPEAAIRRIERNVTAFRWHQNLKRFVDIIRDNKLRGRIKSGETEVGGVFKVTETADNITVEIHLDGAHSVKALAVGAKNDAGKNMVEGPELMYHIYTHELTHGIDGYEKSISSSQEWKEAFLAEIASGKLSNYATTSPAEGFAEFGRMVYASNKSREWIRDNFPLAMKVWEGYEL